jgi:hypothetical protein
MHPPDILLGVWEISPDGTSSQQQPPQSSPLRTKADAGIVVVFSKKYLTCHLSGVFHQYQYGNI